MFRNTFRKTFRPTAILLGAVFVIAVGFPTAGLRAADGVFQPLNQRTPPGVAGYWAGMLGRATPRYLQPVRISLPSTGDVTFYDVSSRTTHPMAGPADARLGVGFTYRIRISNMPEFPKRSLYPSIELLDRLHPPRSKADRFPIPIAFTEDEIELALSGRLVTKVVYLEQPQLAVPLEEPLPTATIEPAVNLLKEADRRGRPMAIVRIGGRQPGGEAVWDFVGRGGPLQFSRDPQGSATGIRKNH